MLTIQHHKDVKLPIVDNSGLQDIIKVNRKGKLFSLSLTLDLNHTHSGDLKIILKAPSGKEVLLHDRSNGAKDFSKKTYDQKVFSKLTGESIKGNWCLQITDFAKKDTGVFNNWSIDMQAEEATKSVGKILVDIPDNDPKGLESHCDIAESGVLSSLECSVNINHSYVGDLTATLIAPSGKKVILHNREGGAKKNLKTTFSKEVTKAFIGEHAKGVWVLKVRDHAKRDAGTLHGWGLSMRIGDNKVDDLTKIEGVGPKIAKLLNDAGLNTFLEVAKASPKAIKKILEAAGPRYQMHDPKTWPRQAGLAALGDWKTLKKWQDELDGGK